MALPKVPRTADDLDDMPDDGQRYEIIEGVLYVSPPPSRRHQRASRLLTRALDLYSEALGLELMYAPADVRAAFDTQVEPDLFVLPHRFEGRDAERWEPMAKVLLCVEVLSPSTALLDRVRKRQLYQAQEVPEYWIVDTESRVIEVWTPGAVQARVERECVTWHAVPARDPLVIDLVALFRKVHDED
ncbi:MAG: Uma2 family endonuclease [Gemmatimonadaceae bacterium]|nr:Uma2 family endonuclease [Gemmatimonadaceae bacterium]